MPAAISSLLEIFGLPAFAGLAASLAMSWFVTLLHQRAPFQSFVPPWTIALSFVIGYSLLPPDFAGEPQRLWNWLPYIAPEHGRPWQWLPYLALITALVSSSLAAISNRWAGIVAVIIAMAIAAALLKPTWPLWGLEPATSRWLLLAYLLSVGLTHQYQPQHLPPFPFLLSLTLAAALLALATGVMVSSRLAQLPAIATAAFAGLAIAHRLIETSGTAHSLVPLYGTLIAGMAWIACIEPDPPKPLLLLIPLLPVSLSIAWAIISRFRPQSTT